MNIKRKMKKTMRQDTKLWELFVGFWNLIFELFFVYVK